MEQTKDATTNIKNIYGSRPRDGVKGKEDLRGELKEEQRRDELGEVGRGLVASGDEVQEEKCIQSRLQLGLALS